MLIRIKKRLTFVSVTHPVLVGKFIERVHLYSLGSYNICTIYLHVIEACDYIEKSFENSLGEKEVGKFCFLCSVKFWCLGKPKRNMYGSNIKELAKQYMNQTEISLSLFEYCDCGVTRTKLLKVIKKALRLQFTMGTNNFLLEAKAKIHFGKRRIH